MKTTLKAISLIIAFSALSATSVSAQSFYPQNAYSGACVNISRTLSYATRGSDVMELQTFLVSQNFPGGGAWMETGFFGGATEAAVKDFQQEVGLPMTGIVDATTEASISRISCGSTIAISNPTIPAYTGTGYPTTIPWNAYNNNNTGYYPYGNGYVSLNLTSLSQNTGSVGAQVTVYGTGFDATGNTVNFGSVALSNVPSNGTSLTFVVPDSRGTSNALAFAVNNYGYSCGNNYLYPYGSYNGSCGCNNAYTYGNNYNNVYPYNNNQYGNCGTIGNTGNVYAPTVTYLSPVSGGVGTSVTVYGTGFTTSNNTVHFGTGIITNLGSNDGQSVSFVVPSVLTGFGSQNIGLGIYNISVTNGQGYSTNAVPFTVTSLGNNGSTVFFTSVNGPSSLPVGSAGTWTVTLNNPSNASVTVTPNWGDTNVYTYNSASAPQSTYAPGTVTLTFTHVYSTSGTYNVSFTATSVNGTQTSASESVVVSGSSGYNGVPAISYLSPNSGYIGQQVTVYGSNFASSETINFGTGAIQNFYSQNGTSLPFTVPSSVGRDCAPGTACPQYLISITPGTYNVSVMDQNGTSNAIPFTVL